MNPLHAPARDYREMLEEDLEAVGRADHFGFDDMWIGGRPSPCPLLVKAAGKHGWTAISFIPAASAATHWQR